MEVWLWAVIGMMALIIIALLIKIYILKSSCEPNIKLHFHENTVIPCLVSECR